jgi:pilus assembly protein CpaB
MLSVVGLSTAAFVAGGDRKASPAVQQEAPTVSVAVATHDLPLGTIIDASDVRLARWPADIAPPTAIHDAATAVGRGVLSQIRQGEPVLRTRLAPEGAGAGLPALIEQGSRALSVRVDDVIGVAGFVQPNTYVDVLVTARANGEARSAVVLQGVKVLATGSRIAADSSSSQSSRETQSQAVVTLLVTPWQAELLTLAATEGHIQLALRNPLDIASAPTTGAGIDQLLPGSVSAPKQTQTKRAPRAASTPTVHGVEVYNGGDKAVLTFRDTAH